MCEIPGPLPVFTYRYPRTILKQRIQILDHTLSVDDVKEILDGGRWTFSRFAFYKDDKAFAMTLYFAPDLLGPPEYTPIQAWEVAIQNYLAWLFVLRHKVK
ncbi:MAG: hypothetical protein K2X29_10510 [Candidatus Obscuribacterales bacterium]|nr:hypothetical protein [Candidatus Obscuribacterales bacterium]